MTKPDLKITLSQQDLVDLYAVSARAVAGGSVPMDNARAWLRSRTKRSVDGVPTEYLPDFISALMTEIAQGSDVLLGRRSEDLLGRLRAAMRGA